MLPSNWILYRRQWTQHEQFVPYSLLSLEQRVGLDDDFIFSQRRTEPRAILLCFACFVSNDFPSLFLFVLGTRIRLRSMSSTPRHAFIAVHAPPALLLAVRQWGTQDYTTRCRFVVNFHLMCAVRFAVRVLRNAAICWCADVPTDEHSTITGTFFVSCGTRRRTVICAE